MASGSERYKEMQSNEYQQLAMRTNDGKCTERLIEKHKAIENSLCSNKYDFGGIINGCLGLAGELGEFNDMIKKWIFHEAKIDTDHLKKELGDVCWYIAMMCDSCGWNLDEILQMNVDKLKARYPEGFDTERSLHRQKGDI
jgi:NTP pyrophosphatase (non-canonical NTP hydrolase)